ncbi:hypothetical protein Droror1_Dr00002041 [Drosera rotundifolia]
MVGSPENRRTGAGSPEWWVHRRTGATGEQLFAMLSAIVGQRRGSSVLFTTLHPSPQPPASPLLLTRCATLSSDLHGSRRLRGPTAAPDMVVE